MFGCQLSLQREGMADRNAGGFISTWCIMVGLTGSKNPTERLYDRSNSARDREIEF